METSGQRFVYPSGTSFRCLRCGICCADASSRERRILLTKAEVEKISDALMKSSTEFAETVEPVSFFRFSMKKTNGRCVFLKENLCTIYDLRPLICKFYPFKLDSLGGGNYVFRGTEECPGLGKGPRLSRRHFEKLFQLFLLSSGS